MPRPNPLDVFINCPFDDAYRLTFHGMVFTLVRAGFRPRCALEVDNGADNRFEKICRIIGECRFAVHDISRTDADGAPPLPRFNMPLELGVFLGAKRFGGGSHRQKSCIIFDIERYRFQRFISDLAGQDIHAHGGDIRTVIQELSAWLRGHHAGGVIPGGAAIFNDFERLQASLPAICADLQIEPQEMTFGDFHSIATQFAAKT